MKLFHELAKIETEGTPAALCTLVEAVGSVPQQPGSKMILLGDGSITGTVGGGALEHRVIADARTVIESGVPTLVQYDTVGDLGMACGGSTSVFIDPVHTRPNLVVFGGGHISRDLSAMAARCAFRVTVIDSRSEWAQPEDFPAADRVLAGDPVALLDELPISADTYLVLVSHSHAIDQRILQTLLTREWRYLGMIASKRKVKQVFAALEGEGADPERLAQVHSPIGLKIGSIDPGEIAVSILAELIKLRRGK